MELRRDVFRFSRRIGVQTGRLPLDVKVVLRVPGILLEIRYGGEGARARSEVTGPFLRQVDTVQCDVGRRTTPLVGGVCLETQVLEARGGYVSTCIRKRIIAA